MTVQEYKQRLLDLEKRLSRHISDEREQAREHVLDAPHDAADDSVADEDESVDFAVAELIRWPWNRSATRCSGWTTGHSGAASSTASRSNPSGSRRFRG